MYASKLKLKLQMDSFKINDVLFKNTTLLENAYWKEIENNLRNGEYKQLLINYHVLKCKECPMSIQNTTYQKLLASFSEAKKI